MARVADAQPDPQGLDPSDPAIVLRDAERGGDRG